MTGCTLAETTPVDSSRVTISPTVAQSRIAITQTVEGGNLPTSKITTPSPTPNATFAPTFAWWDEESEKSKEIGNKIVVAIENYYQDFGNYPKSLEDLIPRYLDEIPQTTTGHGFAYQLYENNYYVLKFPFTRRNIACGYSNGPDTIGGWECTQFLSYP